VDRKTDSAQNGPRDRGGGEGTGESRGREAVGERGDEERESPGVGVLFDTRP